MDFKSLLQEDGFILLDGGMGTMLQANGLVPGDIPEIMNVTHPELIESIHKSYLDAGSMVVYTNTFGANRSKLEGSGHTVSELIGAGAAIARKAVSSASHKAYTALDLGPVGQLLEPTGSLSFEEAYNIFKEQIIAGADTDLIVIETMSDLYETKAALLAAKENSDKPVICTMTFEESGRTFTGCSVSAMAMTLEGLGADAVGVNCSLGPDGLYDILDELASSVSIPIAAKPNAGLPDPETGAYNTTPEEFARQTARLSEIGVKIFGGCCGTSPEFIRLLAKELEGLRPIKCEVRKHSAVCTPAKTVVIDQPRIIGERINPTGKKRFKEALMNNDIDYILGQAIEQVRAGADILDVNVGLPDIDEKEMMVRTVKAIQGVTDLPLQIDSTIPEVLEAALRVYNGKPIVNSVNGEEKSLSVILPIVKKYGAAVVGLTLDENGIPKTADERFAIAQRILDRAMKIGIPKEDVFIDCLTLTASAEQDAVMETVKAVHRVKNELGLRTVLGVSNISFGLPNRELVNCNFLQMCLTNGLDLPIINPNAALMTGAVRAYKLLTGIDRNSMDYIRAYKDVSFSSSVTPKDSSQSDGSKSGETMNLSYAIENGLKGEAGKITAELLKTTDPMDIVNEMLIPALDKAGDDFEAGRIFLPQLILSAGAAQSAFEAIKNNMSGDKTVSKGKVVLATVKNDIHDIGKNIVKVLLENYGFEVIDLGRDVEHQAVVDAAIEHDVRLVGLSALMTTTLKDMEATVKLLHENNVNCKIVVGGAVLTPEYAEKIGADFYAKDAKETVDIAHRVYGVT